MIYRRLSTKLTFLEHSTQKGQDSLFKHIWNILQDGPSSSKHFTGKNKLKSKKNPKLQSKWNNY